MDFEKFDEAERLVRCIRDVDYFINLLNAHPLWLVVNVGENQEVLNRLDSYAEDVIRPMLIAHYKQIRKDYHERLLKL